MEGLSPEILKMLEGAGTWGLSAVILGSLFIRQYFAYKLKKLDEDGELRRLEIEREEKEWDTIVSDLEVCKNKLTKLDGKVDMMEGKLIDLLYKLNNDKK